MKAGGTYCDTKEPMHVAKYVFVCTYEHKLVYVNTVAADPRSAARPIRHPCKSIAWRRPKYPRGQEELPPHRVTPTDRTVSIETYPASLAIKTARRLANNV